MSGPLGMVCECSWCGENWRHGDIGGVRCDRCAAAIGLCPPCWWTWRDHHPPRPKCCQLNEVVMEPMGQNLGGSERSREDVLLAEVRRLQSQLHDVAVETKKSLNALRYGGDHTTIDGHLCRVLRVIEGGAT